MIPSASLPPLPPRPLTLSGVEVARTNKPPAPLRWRERFHVRRAAQIMRRVALDLVIIAVGAAITGIFADWIHLRFGTRPVPPPVTSTPIPQNAHADAGMDGGSTGLRDSAERSMVAAYEVTE